MDNRKELPQLPYGMGNYSYVRDTEKICYKKQVTVLGKKKRISVVGSSIKEVNKLMKEKEQEENDKAITPIKDSRNTLQDSLKKWMELYKKNDVSSRSYDRIESSFNSQIKDSDLGTTLEALVDSDMIQEFMNGLINTKTKEPLSYSSKKKVFELLDQYFAHQYIANPSQNPMIRVKHPVKTEEEHIKNDELIIWDDDEIWQLQKEAMKTYTNGVSGYKHGAAIMFIMWTFIRIGEALALQWKDIDLEEGMLNISKSYGRVKKRDGENDGKYEYRLLPTKGKKTRKFKMCKEAIKAIEQYKEEKLPKSEEDFVFTGKEGILTENTILNMYYLICRNAELPEKNVTIHGLRHTGISYFLRHGVPVEVVSRMAGHQTIQITLDTYYQVIEEQKNKAIDSLDEIMEKKKSENKD